MTYNEYYNTAGVYKPDTIFATITAVNGVSLKDLFEARYGDRELFVADTAKFGKFLKIYAATNCAHYKNLITAMTEAATLASGDLTRTITAYASPSGTPDTAYSTGMTKDKLEHDKTDIEKLTKYITDITMVYTDLLSSFEPLFMGVI